MQIAESCQRYAQSKVVAQAFARKIIQSRRGKLAARAFSEGIVAIRRSRRNEVGSLHMKQDLVILDLASHIEIELGAPAAHSQIQDARFPFFGRRRCMFFAERVRNLNIAII